MTATPCFVKHFYKFMTGNIALREQGLTGIRSVGHGLAGLVPKLLFFILLINYLNSNLRSWSRWNIWIRIGVALQPRLQRVPVALQGVAVAVENAGLTAASAALLQGGLPGRQRAGIVGGTGRVRLAHRAIAIPAAGGGWGSGA